MTAFTSISAAFRVEAVMELLDRRKYGDVLTTSLQLELRNQLRFGALSRLNAEYSSSVILLEESSKGLQKSYLDTHPYETRITLPGG